MRIKVWADTHATLSGDDHLATLIQSFSFVLPVKDVAQDPDLAATNATVSIEDQGHVWFGSSDG